jgi:hypothetical protein
MNHFSDRTSGKHNNENIQQDLLAAYQSYVEWSFACIKMFRSGKTNIIESG